MSKRKITNSQAKEIVQLFSDDSHSSHHLRVELTKNIIPHLFKEETNLKRGSWIKNKEQDSPWIVFATEDNLLFGINREGNWFNSDRHKENVINKMLSNTNNRLATEQEVTEALTKEAVKRGFNYKGYCLTLDNYFYGDNGNRLEEVFSNGFWATAFIPTISKEQAEKELGKKII